MSNVLAALGWWCAASILATAAWSALRTHQKRRSHR